MIVYLHSLLAAVQLGQVGHLEAGLAAVVAASELVVSLLAAAAAEVILILGLAGKAAGQEVHSTHTIQVQAWAVVVEWVWAATLEAAAEEEAVPYIKLRLISSAYFLGHSRKCRAAFTLLWRS